MREMREAPPFMFQFELKPPRAHRNKIVCAPADFFYLSKPSTKAMLKKTFPTEHFGAMKVIALDILLPKHFAFFNSKSVMRVAKMGDDGNLTFSIPHSFNAGVEVPKRVFTGDDT